MEGHKINTAPEFVLTDNLKAHRGLIMSEVPERRRFRNGQQLSRGGTPSPQVYFILEGAARASVVNVYGYERTLGCIARDARLQKQLEVIAQNAQALARIPAAAPQAGAILRAVQEIKE